MQTRKYVKKLILLPFCVGKNWNYSLNFFLNYAFASYSKNPGCDPNSQVMNTKTELEKNLQFQKS